MGGKETEAANKEEEAGICSKETEAAYKEEEAGMDGKETEAANKEEETGMGGKENEAANKEKEAGMGSKETEAANKEEEAGISGKETEAANKEVEKLQTETRKKKRYSTSPIINHIFETLLIFLAFKQKYKPQAKLAIRSISYTHHHTLFFHTPSVGAQACHYK